MGTIRIKRIYDAPAADDGYRVLVDRLWPRGVKKTDARLDEWNREVSPSPALRQWFDHDPERFAAFGSRYLKELSEKSEALAALKERAATQNVTLLYAAKSPQINHAVVLLKALEKY